MNPLASIRSWIFLKIRLWNKNIIVTPRVSHYVENFVLENESSFMKDFLMRSSKLFRADMQTEATQARFLSLMVKATRSKRVLEIGTFRGFGTANMAQALPEDGEIITCELSEKYANEASKLFEKLEISQKIKIKIGNATETLDLLIGEKQKFDLIFIDADKENYQTYFDKSLGLISSGGTILIDNTLWASLVAFDNSGNKAGELIKEFNKFVFSKCGERAVIIPAWDGVTMIVMN